MDDFARQRATDRADLFRTVATQRGFSPAIVEKDFWVCWTLKRLFALDDKPAGLLFKGGTSLSKVFKIIERFSEDIDLSFDRSDLGFSGSADPLTATTGKRRQKGLKALSETCRDIIRETFLPQLRTAFEAGLERGHAQRWSLELADDDPDQQTVVFRYPSSTGPRPANEPAYIRPVVRLEIGARSEHWPVVEAKVTPFVAEDFPALFTVRHCVVRALSAERTFWEKATALHAWYHAPADKPLGDRYSRHYYDVACLYETAVGRSAIKNTELLLKVAEHKAVFFASAWANYETARPGTLRLVPPDSRLGDLRRDYQSMREMIFSEPPTFEHILDVLHEIEVAVNAPS